MAILESQSADEPSSATNHLSDKWPSKSMNKLEGSELSLQVVYLDFIEQILIVCTGLCGESFCFIEKENVKVLLRKSLSIHQYIDKLVGDEGEVKAVTNAQRRGLSNKLRELGEFLFSVVFRGDILDIFNMTIGQASVANTSVLVRVMIANDFLNIIPWELLYDNETYLCHVYDIIRHPFIHQPVHYTKSHNGDMRVLFVGANPLGNIRVKGQIDAVKAALETREDSFRSLLSPNATYKEIANALYDGVDILHLLAHGKYEYIGNYQNYYFIIDTEDSNKKQDRLPVAMLESFCRANPMYFAVLSACKSDQAINYNLRSLDKLIDAKHNSMAHALVQTGVPCVIGMSHPISKMGAELFTRRLYRTVIDRQESIGKAVRLARLELFAHSDDLLPSDWLTPVLYSRARQIDSSA